MVKICEVEFPTELGKCDIIIEESNSDTPYFVIKNDHHEIRLDIFESKYYDNYDYTLLPIECEILNNLLSEDHLIAPEIFTWKQDHNHWQWLAAVWSEVNDDTSDYPQKDEEIKKEYKPNYTNLGGT